MSDNREDIANVGLDAVAFGEPEGGGLLRLSIFSLQEGMKKQRVAIYDLNYSALKVHQNTGRGEVKRNPCIEFADV